MGEMFSAAARPLKTLVIGYYGVRVHRVKRKSWLISSQCKVLKSDMLQACGFPVEKVCSGRKLEAHTG
jgi:hypothetical protein